MPKPGDHVRSKVNGQYWKYGDQETVEDFICPATRDFFGGYKERNEFVEKEGWN
jgi:hypothetical protein